MKRKKTPGSLIRKRSRLVARLPDLERLLRGSIVERYKKCGKPGCHCVEDRGHGPAYYLSVTFGPGKTRSYYVSAKQKKRILKYLENYQKLRELTEQIMSVNRELLEQGELDDDY
jgi:hypothetical protein